MQPSQHILSTSVALAILCLFQPYISPGTQGYQSRLCDILGSGGRHQLGTGSSVRPRS